MDLVEEWVWEHATKYAFVKILKSLKSKRYTGELPTSWLSALLLSRVQRYWGKSSKVDFRVLINVQDTLTSVAKFYGKELQKKIKVNNYICLVLACRAAILAMRINCDQATWRKALDDFFPIWSPKIWNKMKLNYSIKDNLLEEELKDVYMLTRKKLFLQKHVKKDILDSFEQKMTECFPDIISFLYNIQLSVLEKIQLNRTHLEPNLGFVKEIIKDGIDEEVILKLLQASQAHWIKQKCLKFRKLAKYKDSDSQMSTIPMENVIYLLPAYGSTETSTEIYPSCCDSYPHMPSQIVLEESGKLQTFIVNKDVAVANNGTKFEPHWFCEVPNGSQALDFHEVEIKQEIDDELTEPKCHKTETNLKDKTYVISKPSNALKDREVDPDHRVPLHDKPYKKSTPRRRLSKVQSTTKEKAVSRGSSCSTVPGTSDHDRENEDDDKDSHSDNSGSDCSIYYSAHTRRTYMLSRNSKLSSKRLISTANLNKQSHKSEPDTSKNSTEVTESSNSEIASPKVNRQQVRSPIYPPSIKENERTAHQIDSTNTKTIRKSTIEKEIKLVENPINQMLLRSKFSVKRYKKTESTPRNPAGTRRQKISESDGSTSESDSSKNSKEFSAIKTRSSSGKPEVNYKEPTSGSDSSSEPSDSSNEMGVSNQSIGRRSRSASPKKDLLSPSKKNSGLMSTGSKPRDIIISTNVFPAPNLRSRRSKEDMKGRTSSPAKTSVSSSEDNCMSPASLKSKKGIMKRKRDAESDEQNVDAQALRPKRLAGEPSARGKPDVPEVIDTLKKQGDRLRLNAVTVSCGKKLDKCIKRIVRSHLKQACSPKTLMNLDNRERVLRSQSKGSSVTTEAPGSDIAERVKHNTRAAKQRVIQNVTSNNQMNFN